MTVVSPAKIKIEKITQIAVAVHNLDRGVENYWMILGVGPTNIFHWEYPTVWARTYGGQPSWSREKICHIQFKNVEFELMEAVEGPSLYRDFIEEHGEGLHHLQCLVPDLDETNRILINEYGFTGLQTGECGRTPKGCRYSYIYIKPLGCIWEFVACPEGICRGPTRRFPATDEPNPSKVKATEVRAAAIAVYDVRQTAENYWKILGIGPWTIYERGAPHVFDRRYHGEPTWGRDRVAVADVGGVQLELVQPVSGDSIYADYLAKHGEGLHHVSFIADDVDKVAATFAADGFLSVDSGRYGSPAHPGAFNAIDIKPLRAIWEVVSREGKNTGAEVSFYP